MAELRYMVVFFNTRAARVDWELWHKPDNLASPGLEAADHEFTRIHPVNAVGVEHVKRVAQEHAFRIKRDLGMAIPMPPLSAIAVVVHHG